MDLGGREGKEELGRVDEGERSTTIIYCVNILLFLYKYEMKHNLLK